MQYLLMIYGDEAAMGSATPERGKAMCVVLAPGNAFSAAQTAGGFIRFNVAQMDDQSFAVLRQLL